jgi:hypothetical protein
MKLSIRQNSGHEGLRSYTTERKVVNDLFETGTTTFLQEEFIYQEYLARLVKINILITEEKDINDTLNHSRYTSPLYEGLENDRFIKEPYTGKINRIREYQENIVNYINCRR